MGPNRYATSEQDMQTQENRTGAESALEQERRQRLELERQVKDLSEESRALRRQAEESDRRTRLREGLKERGVRKTHLALRLLEPDVRRNSDGELVGDWEGSLLPLDDYLNRFVQENPEFLPPRISGGSGSSGGRSAELTRSGFDLDAIRPGMKPDETREAWNEVARLIGASGPGPSRD